MDIEEVLIKEVHKHDCLFDISSPLYKDIIEKDRIWAEIGERLGLDGELCRKKWRGLRDTFRRVKRTHRTLGRSRRAGKKTWRHYNAMAFLDGVQSCRRSIGNVSAVEDARPDSSPYNKPKMEAIFIPSDICSDSPDYKTPEVEPDFLPSPLPSCSPVREHINEEFSYFLKEMSERAKDLTEKVQQVRQQTSTELIFSGLAKSLDSAKLAPDVLISAQRRVSSLVYDILQNSLSQ